MWEVIKWIFVVGVATLLTQAFLVLIFAMNKGVRAAWKGKDGNEGP